jgi:hypothetical protein
VKTKVDFCESLAEELAVGKDEYELGDHEAGVGEEKYKWGHAVRERSRRRE